ncbi:MAG TPA: DUF4982 domain-containing protein, partial [Puia sp.]|nr:DUF4982 domain-containing protein [Puia sp.]
KKKAAFEYRLRWDSVRYEPGELKVLTYKDGKPWATDVIRTAGNAAGLQLDADPGVIKADGCDLSFITVRVVDSKGVVVPTADNKLTFAISGPGEIVATDNGNPADLVSFASPGRAAFSGLALVIVQAKPGTAGTITVKASSDGLPSAEIVIQCK